jgi:hypothetical protein
MWLEHCSLLNHTSRAAAGNLELQPSAPGKLHFRRESQETVAFDRVNPPEVNGISGM